MRAAFIETVIVGTIESRKLRNESALERHLQAADLAPGRCARI